MNSLQDRLTDFIPVLVFIGTSDMLRGIIAPEIEKELGRKLKDSEWEYYLQENYRKAEAESQQQIVRQWMRQLVDMKIIHDFVWSK